MVRLPNYFVIRILPETVFQKSHLLLVKTQGGYSIAVHDGSVSKRKQSEKLLNENRVDFTAKADYRKNSELSAQVMRVIDKIAAEHALVR